MSKLPVVSAKELEKLLLKLGFTVIREKGVISFINIPMAGTPQSLIIQGKIFRDHLSGQY